MRIVQNFNKDWLFIPEQVADELPDHEFEPVTLPHTNKLFSGRFVDNQAYQFVSTYRKRFIIEEDATDKQVFITFDGAMLETTVYLNGKHLGVHSGGYTPFSFDITEHLIPSENLLTVYVDAAEHAHIPPYGNLVDFLTFGGLYRDVSLSIVDQCHIAQVFAKTADVLDTPRLDCDIKVTNWSPGLEVTAVIEDSQGQAIARQTRPLKSDSDTISFSDFVSIELWSLDNPALYHVKLILSRHDQPIDTYDTRFGFRSAEFRSDGRFYLNGQPLKLFGLNRHQTYPYIGAAAPARLQQLDADILKYELGCNIVRTSHYAQSSHFLNRCDEVGLLVFEEIAGWQHIGDAAWQTLVLQDLQSMIERDRHHPSIMLWGVRVNESRDDDRFYAQTNTLAHQIDPTRQTGGVRNFLESQQLEDVFTLNDFTEVIQTPRPPHLITEFVGHMFPAKTWDHEERRVEHALKHAQKHNLQYGHPGVAGAIAWCAFDYHTHKEFGSGDRICHHGVMDIFRLPKMAAYFYRSQKSPDDEIVLYAATNWTMGDRSGGGNNPLVVFSNCERIEVLIGEQSQGYFDPDRNCYPHLPYPPFQVAWPEPYNPWGAAFDDLTVRGFMSGRQVAEHKIAADHLPNHLRLSSNTAQLQADGSDMARVAVQIEDKYNNTLPYQMAIVTWTVEGPGVELIGENPLALLGGQGACFIKAGHEVGRIVVRAAVPDLEPVSLTLDILN